MACVMGKHEGEYFNLYSSFRIEMGGIIFG